MNVAQNPTAAPGYFSVADALDGRPGWHASDLSASASASASAGGSQGPHLPPPGASNRARAGLTGCFGRLSTEQQAAKTFKADVKQWKQAAPTSVEGWARWMAARSLNNAYRKKAADLDLHDLGLSTLPRCLKDMPNVKKLQVSHNGLDRLAALPPALQELSAHCNFLTKIDALPKGLTRLLVDENFLQSLPPLPATLTELHACNNVLEALPAPLPPALKVLMAPGNDLTSLPALPEHLERINYDGNPLGTTPRLPPGCVQVSF